MARAWLTLALGLAALLPLSAAAQDLTATYREGTGAERHIEIAANGDLRSNLEMDSYLLSHDGVDYLVMPGPGGPLVIRVDDIVAARAGHPRQTYPPSNAQPSSRGTVMVNGRSGIAYGYPPLNGEARPPYLVVSNDPELAPLGRAFHRLSAIQDAIDTNFEPSPNDPTDTLIGTGAPIHLFALGDLVAVSHASVPAARFALPAPPQSREETLRDFAPDDRHEDDADASQRRMIKRAVYAGGSLWLLADNGTMTTIDASHRPATVATPPGTRDLCRFNGSPVIVAGDAAHWTLQRWGGTGWEPWQTIAAQGDELVGLLCTDERYDLLTNHRLIEISGAGERSVRLSGLIRPSLIASMYDDGAALFVGSDAGEFGGGLVRIDRATGKVTDVEKRGPGLCSGPLNAACDPVNGIAAEPGKPDCLIASIGLQHFLPSGHLVEICGNRIVTYYAKPYTLDPDWHYDPKAPEARESVPFYSLAASGDALWAVGTDGLYRIEAGGGIRFTKLPAFEKIGGIWVSFALPDMALVMTSINARRSIGGPAILLIPE
jgi:hypothetical protein